MLGLMVDVVAVSSIGGSAAPTIHCPSRGPNGWKTAKLMGSPKHIIMRPEGEPAFGVHGAGAVVCDMCCVP